MGNIQNMLFQKQEVIATGKNSQMAYETHFLILKLTQIFWAYSRVIKKTPGA